MKKRVRIFVVTCSVFILLGFYILSIPQERLLHQQEYSSLESYPVYYYTNFNVTSSETNAELSFNLNVDVGTNLSSYMIFWLFYQLQLAQFEKNFNLTEARNEISDWNNLSDWDLDAIGAFWAGGGRGDYMGGTDITWSPIPTDTYIFVFWIEPDEAITGWSATLAFSLRTSILPRL
jgi:hypothetical protein